MTRQTKQQSGNSMNIKGDVDTGGGDIAAGDIRKRDVYQSHGSGEAGIQNLFQPIYEKIESHDDLKKDDKEDLETAVKEIEQAVAKEEVDETFIERRLRNIARIAPDILEVVLTTLSNPLIGLATVAQKIAQKAKPKVKKKVKPG